MPGVYLEHFEGVSPDSLSRPLPPPTLLGVFIGDPVPGTPFLLYGRASN